MPCISVQFAHLQAASLRVAAQLGSPGLGWHINQPSRLPILHLHPVLSHPIPSRHAHVLSINPMRALSALFARLRRCCCCIYLSNNFNMLMLHNPQGYRTLRTLLPLSLPHSLTLLFYCIMAQVSVCGTCVSVCLGLESEPRMLCMSVCLSVCLFAYGLCGNPTQWKI